MRGALLLWKTLRTLPIRGKSGKPNLSFNLDVETQDTSSAWIGAPLTRPEFHFRITCDLAHITDG